MEKKLFLKKTAAFIIITLFIAASFIPSISGNATELDKKQSIKSQKQVNDQEDVLVACYNFGLFEQSTKDIEMPYSEVEELLGKISEYATEIAYDSQSEKAQQLQQEIFTLTYELGLLPEHITTQTLQTEYNLLSNKQNKGNIPFSVLQNRGSAFFCNFATTGTGSQFPIIIFPRLIPIIQLPIPRVFLRWTASDGFTSCGGLLSGKGFIAYGQQKGLALGFWGIGFSVFLPPIMQYGFIGYALYARVDAEVIDLWPPNNPPVISDENPISGTWDVPVSLSEISFRINDADGDLMSYTVTTDPDIGSGSGNLKPNGIYSVPVSNLEPDILYDWTIEVADGEDTINEQFSFCTEALPFNPFNEGWQYRKKITIDHSKVDGDLENFPVLLSTSDADLRDKAQDDGDDILFMDDTGIAKKLYHEIELFDESSGELLTWINIADISSNEDTEFYMYYGNPTSNNQQFPERVWDIHYEAVWHMDDHTQSTIEDSTSNDNTGVKENGPSEINAKIGKAQDFEESDKEEIIIYDGVYECDSDEDITMEYWIKMETFQGFAMNCDNDDYGYYSMNNKAAGYFSSYFFSRHPYTIVHPTGTTFCQPDIWYYVAGKLDRNAGYGYIYVDGLEEARAGIDELGGLEGLHHFRIGGSYSSAPSTYTDGIIDEVRISNIARKPAWILTSFQNQNDPSSFLSFGSEEPAP